MKRIIYRFVLAFVFLIILNGCSVNEKEAAFKELLPIGIGEMNSQIQLSIPVTVVQRSSQNKPTETEIVGPEDLTGGDSFEIVVENLTQDLIVFPNDSGLTILHYNSNEDKWIQIENVVEYIFDTGDMTLHPEGPENPLGFTSIPVTPALEDLQQPIEIRILVIGTVYEDGEPTDQQVGAYVDVTLKP